MKTEALIEYLQENIFKLNNMIIENIRLENQNKEYKGATFTINNKSFRLRQSKITPKKKGEFLTIWKKDSNNKNIPFSYNDSPDYLMVVTSNLEYIFLFPKDILLKHKILSSNDNLGKMAFRIYPPKEILESKQAINTQIWQVNFLLNKNFSIY